MTVLQIIEWPAKVLETKAQRVEVFDEQLKTFAQDMHETMKHAGGIGLAANQVNVLKRVLTIHIPWSENRYSDQEELKEWWHDQKFTLVNPEIVKKQGKIRYREGCLSFPDVFDLVDRAAEIKVRAQDESGKELLIDANGLFSVCLQHEIDHLDGIVFVNRMSRLKSVMIKKKILRRVQFETVEPGSEI